MMYTNEKKILRRTVKTYYFQNYLYFINTKEIIEIKVNESSFGQKLALALHKSKKIEPIFKKFLSKQETLQLMELLHESDMLIEDESDLSDCNTTALEIPLRIKTQDSLTNIYYALKTLDESGLKLFSQTYVSSFGDSKKPLWKIRKVKVDETFFSQCNFATVKINYKNKSIYGFGFSSDGKSKALAIAMLESLERLYTMYKLPKPKVYNTSYSKLKTTAIDPTRLNWFSKDQYNTIDFQYQPFNTSLPLDWVKASSLTKNTTTLLPMQALISSNQKKKFIPITSNGCAIHSCTDAALIAGIEEIIERDILLKVWYHKLSVPKILDANNLIKTHKLGQLLMSMGFTITLLDGTLDLGIPVIIGLFEDKKNESLFRINAATGVSPEIAVEKLLKEFFMVWRAYILESDSSELIYKGARKFLKKSNLETKSNQMPWSNLDNVKLHLEHLIHIISEKGLEIIKVDCSSKLLEKLGLVAVKIIIIGAIPLFAGPNMPIGIERFQFNGQFNKFPHPYC